MFTFLLNIIWLVFGGFWMAVGWFIAGILMVISIVGIPFARAAFNIGIFAFWPFGRWVEDRGLDGEEGGIGTGPLGTVGNVVWVVFAGWWLALGHILIGLCLFFTIVGIPFAWQHVKMAVFAVWPIGRRVVDIDPGNAWPFARKEKDELGQGTISLPGRAD